MFPLSAAQEAALLATLMGWPLTSDQLDVMREMRQALYERHEFREAMVKRGEAG